MSSDNQILTFYDIASAQPHQTFAANPWKTRLALNRKGIPYKTQCTQMPDITRVREELGVPANRTLPDGTPYHTLPVISDPSTGTLLGDTFEIALYLDRAYPDAPRLIPENAVGLTAMINQHVDGIFTKYALLCEVMPFDPAVLPAVLEMFAARAKTMGVKTEVTDESREAMMVQFEASLGELAKAYRHTGGTTDYFWRPGGTDEKQKQRPPPEHAEQAGPWLDGSEPVYADFVVGAWLKMFERSMRKEHWERLREWQEGLWGRVVDALEPYAGMK